MAWRGGVLAELADEAEVAGRTAQSEFETKSQPLGLVTSPQLTIFTASSIYPTDNLLLLVILR